ncbi:TonB-dependent receptor [Azospirillum agricola]|uniref:TonB-dependent receptor n=1 Tax=Azospirillum agricola TaxID=1720247 RepID=UPI001CC1BD5F|nr:TonB-dependent receptor [Azospirillum agricola]
MAVTAALSGGALAQEAAGDAGQTFRLEPVVITGEKVTRSIQDTASSVSAFTAGDIDNKVGAASVPDLIGDVPNVVYTGTVSAPIIRGQDSQGPNFGSTAFFGGTIPRATINLDGHYLNFYEYVYGGTGIWDVESVEVFRGPQTTAQGANAIAGAIIVNTKDPTFTPEGSYQAELGSHNRKRGSLALSGPIVGSELAGRVAVDYWGRDTFIDYVSRNFARGGTNLDFRSLNGRAKLLWKPEAIAGLTAKLTYAHTANNRPTWEAASAPYDRLDNATTSMPSWKQRGDTGVVDLGYEFGNGLALHNQTQYSNMHVDRVAAPANNGSAAIDQQNYSNETRLTFGDAKSTVSGVVGLYAARTTSDDTLHIRGVSDFDDRRENLGVFTELTYRLDERWSLTGGLRHQRDSQRRTGLSSYSPRPLAYDESFQAWLPKLSLAYSITPDATVGAMVSKGYNPGGVNLSFASSRYITFGAETVWNYELFGRARLLDRRLTLNGNVFYSDFRNSQRLLPDYLNGVQYGSIAVNADKAESYGLEVSADYLVTSDLRVRAGAGLLHTEIGRFANAYGAIHKGHEFGGAPGYMLSLAADWDVTPTVRLTGEIRHTDGYHSTDENKPAYEVGNLTVANLRASYAPRDYLQIYTYVNNLFDRRAVTYLSDDRSVGGLVANMIEPRTLGIGIKGSF